MRFTAEAPAKINWFLFISGKRNDGYHDIVTAMQRVSLSDRISFEEAAEVDLISDLDIPPSENLVYRAAELLKRHSRYSGGARIVLEKKIPHAAGLGGGSSDAACTLKGLNRLWGLDFDADVLMELGARLGSDVPFFIGESPFAFAEGRGERVRGIAAKASVWMLLVKPDIGVSTAWAYGAYKPELTKKSVDIKLFCQALDRKDYPSLRQMIGNDLEKGVVGKCRVIADIKGTLLGNGAVVAAMSGSGSSVFGVFSSRVEAEAASSLLRKHWCRVVRTLV
ncbi:MAG: 4-(cytidine 5'-diphospho)-2-C-methyl-D-erythritol kinase [Nitrospiraceae bacterium]|nr:4-(cytidine 5'-diphospho)-2-C-methyl-D-erythritol kinase [Nitrospiraceae bacterium]